MNHNPIYQHFMRPANRVMQVARMGSFFPTRLSFIPQLMRRAQREQWQFSRTKFTLDARGVGTAIYRVVLPERSYSLVVFSHDMPDVARNDRVTATAWDATFSLIDGEVETEDIVRLRQNTPKQEAGRFSTKELVLSRANKSMRLFKYVVDVLAQGQQPDISRLNDVGYLMRTTAVYGSGKFGCADREKIAQRPEFHVSFQVEMLAVYLIRWFSIDLVNHMAHMVGGKKAVTLRDDLAEKLGIGNSTGLGMVPFLVKHHQLIDRWISTRETALAQIRQQQNPPDINAFIVLFAQAQKHVMQWQVEDSTQQKRIILLQQELAAIKPLLPNLLGQAYGWDTLIRHSEDYSLETQELMVALVLFPHGDMIDQLGEQMQCHEQYCLQPKTTIATLQALLQQHYAWALKIDFTDPAQHHHWWYYSAEKIEPRRGLRQQDHFRAKEIPLNIAHQVYQLWQRLQSYAPETTLITLLGQHPYLRAIVARVQSTQHAPYGEIRDNLLAAHIRPIDILRAKLAFFGVMKFDPKSELWLRVNMYQGYPLPHHLATANLESPALAYPTV